MAVKLKAGRLLGGAVSLATGNVGGAISNLSGAVTKTKKTVTGTGAPSGVHGGTVVGRSHGLILIQAESGHILAVKTQKRRRYVPRRGGTSMSKLMELAMIKSMMKG